MSKIKQWLKPPRFEDEAKTRTASLLHYLLLTTLLLLGLLIIGQIATGNATLQSGSTYILGGLWLILLVLEISVRQGYVKQASFIFVISAWLAVNLQAWQASGVYDSAFIANTATILLAGLLLGWRSASILTALTIVYAWILVYADTNGLLTYNISRSSSVALDLTIIFALIAVILGLTIYSLENAIKRVTTSEKLLASANKELQEAQEQLEIRVEQRTQELALAAEIGQSVSQIRDISELATTAVSLIQQRFNLYHAQLYLANTEQGKLTLFSGTGEAGKQMLAAKHSLPIDTTSLNGHAALEKQTVIVSDTATRDDFKPNPLLPHTRSETAVPLLVGNNVVGVLDLQSDQPNTFTDESLPAFVTLAGQLAVAIENSTLFTEQARLTTELQSNASFLDTIFDSLPLMLFVKDAQDLRFVRYNQAGADMIGVPVEEMLGKSDYDFFPKEEADFFISKDREVLENGTILDIPEEPIHTAHRGVRYLHTTKVPILDAQGQPQYLLGIADDITERKAIEAELEKFKLGMERSADAIFLTNIEGSITYVNDAFVDIYGYTKEEALGQTPRIIKSGMIPQENYEYFWQTLLSGGIIAGEIVNKTKDDRLLNIEGNNNPILDESGQVIGFLSMHRDITERKQAEETNQEREALLRTIIDSTLDWMFITDTNHRYQMVNQAYATLMNLSPEDFIGKNALEMSVPEDVVKGDPEKGIVGIWPLNEKIMASGEIHIVDEELTDVYGKSHIVTTTRVPLKDSAGNVNGLVSYIHDITDIKEAETIMAKQAKELQTVADLSTAVSTRMDTEQLLIDVVNRTKESFGLYHVHIYLLDEANSTLKLTAGAGDAGTAMVDAGYQIPIEHGNSLVAKVARTKQGVIINNVMADPAFLPNPLLFDTKSEMAVPMMIGNKVIGVLDAQADRINHFTDTDINIQTTLATQIAVALENARAFQQANEQVSIIQATPNIIATSTLDGKITFMNDSGLRRLGYESLAKIIGQPITIFYPPDSNPEHRQQAMEAVIKHGVWQGENSIITKSGEVFPVDQIVTLIRDDNGIPKMTAVNMTDITERKKAEEAQQALNAEMEAQLERTSALQRAMTREGWQAFMTTTAGKRPFQGFEFNQDGIKTLTTQDLTNGKSGKGSSKPKNDETEVINPVQIQGTTIGKIGVRNPSGQPLTDEQRILLTSLTSQVAEALDRARLFEETELGRQEIEEQAAELSTVNEISELVSTQLNINDLFNAVGDRLIETFAATSVYIALVDEKTRAISFPYFTNIIDGPVNIPPRMLDNKGGFTAKVYQTRQPIIHNPTDQNFASATVAGGGEVIDGTPDTNSYIGIPMTVGEQVIGVIGINGQQDRRMYDEEDIPLLTTLSSTIAVALQNAQQFEDTQRRANREALVNEINQKIQNSPTIETAMQTAVAELGKALNLKRAVVKLNKPDSNGK